MREQQPNPDDMLPETQPDNPVERSPSLEALSATELAAHIMSEYGTPYSNNETDTISWHCHWANGNQILWFHLVEYAVNDTPEYLLDIQEKGVSRRRQYVFSTIQPEVTFSYTDGPPSRMMPSQSVVQDELQRYLGMRYEDTTHYAHLTDTFADITARFSAEYALDYQSEFESGNDYIRRMHTSDATLQNSARRRLYRIAELAGVICDETSFNRALDMTIAERSAQNTAYTDPQGPAVLPKITDLTTPHPPKPWYWFLRNQ